MIAKEQLQAMSDFEVNKALCTMLGKDVSGVDEQRNMMTGAVTDYCDKYSAIMPLAFEHRIQLMPFQDCTGTEWFADQIFNSNPDSAYSDINPLRAIACCLILVLQEKQK